MVEVFCITSYVTQHGHLKAVELMTSLCCLINMSLYLSTNRCKENHPTTKVGPDNEDTIAELKDSIKDRTYAFSEMEAFLPKKNG